MSKMPEKVTSTQTRGQNIPWGQSCLLIINQAPKNIRPVICSLIRPAQMKNPSQVTAHASLIKTRQTISFQKYPWPLSMVHSMLRVSKGKNVLKQKLSQSPIFQFSRVTDSELPHKITKMPLTSQNISTHSCVLEF